MKDEKNSLQSERSVNQQPNESSENDKGKERHFFDGLLLVLEYIVIILIVGGFICWLVISKWKKIFKFVEQAEKGTFIGDHPTLTIAFFIISAIVSTIFAIHYFLKDK